ncbi:MAG: hypothetical protein U0S36_14895 [Candidatus Nanopelagicales bacterium]
MHARIVRVDTTAAKAADGVVAVYTGADFPSRPVRPASGPSPTTSR